MISALHIESPRFDISHQPSRNFCSSSRLRRISQDFGIRGIGGRRGRVGMSNAPAIPFHAGPELSRAINRTDFFRLLKSAAQHYNFDNFALARISEASAPFSERDIVITNVAER